MEKVNQFSIRQGVFFGELSYTLGAEEAAILQLITGENANALAQWEKLWSSINDYEELPFSCKELMPSAVKKIQSNHAEAIWAKNIPGHADFLSGLPRYTWTKNQYIIKQYQVIAAALENEQIEFLALKGVCEMLDGNELALMRTSRDIDLLIHEKDWPTCQKVISALGWKRYLQPLHIRLVDNPIKPHAETFQNAERIFDLDIHFTVIPGPKSNSERFTESLWKRKVAAKNFPNLFIPCISDRLIISVANAMGLHNWLHNHTTKYLFDSLAISQRMNQAQITQALDDGEYDLQIGKQIKHVLEVVTQLSKNRDEAGPIGHYAYTKIVSKCILTQIIRLQILVTLGQMLLTQGELIKITKFIGYKFLYKIFIGLPLKGLAYFKSSPQKKISIPKRHSQFSIQLFPRSRN